MTGVAPAHVWALRVALPLEQVDGLLVRDDGVDTAGLLGLTEEDGVTTAWFRERPSATAPDGLSALGRWEQVVADGWDRAWREGLEPVHAGGFVVTPPWRATAPAAGGGTAADEIVIEPAQAFGTGHHETTTLCLEALAAVSLTSRSVLDVGTGTGVLAIAAVRRGAAHVVACDTDPVAVATATENARRNGVPAGVLRVVEGSLDAVPAAPARFDVVVANLDTATVCALAPALVDRCAGRLIVSGVSRARADEAAAALAAAGLQPARRDGSEWTLLHGPVRSGPAPRTSGALL